MSEIPEHIFCRCDWRSYSLSPKVFYNTDMESWYYKRELEEVQKYGSNFPSTFVEEIVSQDIGVYVN